MNPRTRPECRCGCRGFAVRFPFGAGLAILLDLFGSVSGLGATTNGFVNFETAPVHPLALSPDLRQLAVCHLAEGRVELFDVTTGRPIHRLGLRVGLDPVSARFRTTNELWVANFISSSVSVIEVDRGQVLATLNQLPGAADVAFAGSPVRAYVTCSAENAVRVFDPVSRQIVTNLVLAGDRPKAMAVSPDGRQVMVAIFESGNASTILAPEVSLFDLAPGPSVVSYPGGPYGGQNPPPNADTGFLPPINPDLSGYAAPQVSHLVKKNAAERWLDDNHGDWTEFVSGSNAAMSGRVVGWDLPDRDVAIIDVGTFGVGYATGLMNICMDLAVQPGTGRIAVVGTDGTNERRFEPNLRGTFVRVRLALVDPKTGAKEIIDLNPHLDYLTPVIPPAARAQSIGDPRGVIWNAAGTRGYVTGMGSGNLVVIGADGRRLEGSPVVVGEGPSGLALDEGRGRLYVWNRFSSTLSALDAASLAVVTNVALFDPTPDVIRRGRRHLYDTVANSGLGQASCASCHVDARLDRLAWDLGNPAGALVQTTQFPGSAETNTYHPMKGPMVTQTLQDMMGVRHWRGDRQGLEDFNVTFTDLLGRDAMLTTTEMQEFKAFLETVVFPPNRFRSIDNTFATNVPLPGLTGLNWEGEFDDEPLPNGDARRGSTLFAVRMFAGERRCDACHNGNSGNGFENVAFALERNDGLLFKGQQLRGLADKLGMNRRQPESRAGFGFLHDGRADTLTRFLVQGADVSEDQDLADLTAFLLSFSGGGTKTGSDSDHEDRSVPAGVGFQQTQANAQPTGRLREMLRVADDGGSGLELIASGRVAGLSRSWLYQSGHSAFRSDRQSEFADTGQLLALASPDHPITFTLVLRGTGRRLGLDRDEDGYFDQTELDLGTDPLDSQAKPSNALPQLQLAGTNLRVHPGLSVTNWITAFDPDQPAQTLSVSLGGGVPPGALFDEASGVFTWSPPMLAPTNRYSIWVRATDDGSPPMSDVRWMNVQAVALRVLGVSPFPVPIDGWWDEVTFEAVAGSRYRLQFKVRLDDDWFDYPFSLVADGDVAAGYLPQSVGWDRFYRVRTVSE